MDLTTMNQMQYTAALQYQNQQPIGRQEVTTSLTTKTSETIDQLRGDISIITEYTSKNTTNKIWRILKTILKKHKIIADEQFIACKEDLKQTLEAKHKD